VIDLLDALKRSVEKTAPKRQPKRRAESRHAAAPAQEGELNERS